MATATLNIRMDSVLKEELDETARALGLSSAAVFNVFARQFVAHGGFPFPVVIPEKPRTIPENLPLYGDDAEAVTLHARQHELMEREDGLSTDEAIYQHQLLHHAMEHELIHFNHAH